MRPMFLCLFPVTDLKKIKYASVVDAFKTKLGNDVNVMYAKGCDIVDKNWPESEILPSEPSVDEWKDINDVVEKAKKCDVAILVLGEDNNTVGESKSKTSLRAVSRMRHLANFLLLSECCYSPAKIYLRARPTATIETAIIMANVVSGLSEPSLFKISMTNGTLTASGIHEAHHKT